MNPRASIWILVVACAACDTQGGDTAATTAVDTVNGMVRVQHSGAAPAWALEPELTLGRLGAAAGEPSPDEFGRIESVIADDGGRLYVADGMALEIRVFEADGAFVRRLGRQGAGPAEMGAIHGATWLSGDTMLVMDYGNARLMRLTTAGEEAGHWRWMPFTGSMRFYRTAAPGEVYVHSFREHPDRGMAAAWVRYTGHGPSDTLDIPIADPRPGTAVTCRGNGIGFFNNPFGEQLITAPAPGRERVVAWSSGYRLAFLDPAGDTVRVITRTIDPVPLPDTAWAAVEERYREFTASWRGADCEGSITRPASLPVLRDVFFDHGGRMLVEHTTGGGTAFDLYDTGGEWLGTFPTPPGLDRGVLPFLRGERLLVVARDSMDVQRVQGYRLAR